MRKKREEEKKAKKWDLIEKSAEEKNKKLILKNVGAV